MRYDLFLSDFDRTLVREDGTVSKRCKDTIHEYITRGGTFAVCTGRPLTSIMPRVHELGLEGLVVGFQGAAIADIKTGKLLKKSGFSHEEVVYLVEELTKRNVRLQMYTVTDYYSNDDGDLLKGYQKVTGIKAIIQPDLLNLVKNSNETFMKALMLVTPEEREVLFPEFVKLFGDKFYVTCSAEWLIEVMPAGENKGAGLRFLSDYFKIPLEKTAAIGDQLNDLPMIEVASGKFTVANADGELKKMARVFASCEEDGVAEALEYAMKDGE